MPAKLTHEDFLDRTIPEPNSGCLLYTGPMHPNTGYGMFGRNAGGGAHRYAYLHAHGSIPDGMHVCHRCDTRLCVNPDHLFLGTAKDNIHDCQAKGRLRHAWAAKNAAKTRCKHGHEFTSDNIRSHPNGGRQCRECANRRTREYKTRRTS